MHPLISTKMVNTSVILTIRNISVELLVISVPLDTVEGVPHHLVVADEGYVLPHLHLLQGVALFLHNS